MPNSWILKADVLGRYPKLSNYRAGSWLKFDDLFMGLGKFLMELMAIRNNQKCDYVL